MARSLSCGLIVAVEVVLASAAMGMIGPVSALAATVAVEEIPGPYEAQVRFRAAAGEENDVVVTRSVESDAVRGVPGRVVTTVTDASAVVTAGTGCAAVDAHTARCSTVEGTPVRVDLGDQDDQLQSVPPDTLSPADPPSPFRSASPIWGDGGSGDDVLDLRGGGAFGILDGGGGRDELYGGFASDLLIDGDRDGATGDGGPGPDVLDGGGGFPGDAVSYHRRTRPVFVDLARDEAAGEAGEGDIIRGIESVVGGAAADRLAGTDEGGYEGNYISGGGGRDRLVGRGGDDRFGQPPIMETASVQHPLVDAVATGSRADKVSCGPGQDRTWYPTATTYVDPACEVLYVHRTLPPRFGRQRRTIGWLAAYPKAHGSSLSYSVSCTDPEDEEDGPWPGLQCAGTVTLRDTSPQRRLLAVGTLPRAHYTLVTRLQFTAAGRRLAARRHGVRAVMRIRGKNLPTATWTIRLELPR